MLDRLNHEHFLENVDYQILFLCEYRLKRLNEFAIVASSKFLVQFDQGFAVLANVSIAFLDDVDYLLYLLICKALHLSQLPALEEVCLALPVLRIGNDALA